MIVDVEETINVGTETFVASDSPSARYAVVFEDNGETGYFYAIQFTKEPGEHEIMNAMSIYDVENVIDKHKPSVLNIVWSDDGLKAALVLNGYAHAVFDFSQKRGYCLRNFPEPQSDWSGHEWSPDALNFFQPGPTLETSVPEA
jgi:hypothetical protein